MTAPFATSSLLPPATARQDARWQRLCRGWSRDQLLQLFLLALGIALLVGALAAAAHHAAKEPAG